MRSKINSIAPTTPVTSAEVFSQAAQACQQVFSFASTARCSAQMLCSVLVWAAAYAGSFYQACQRLFPQTQDQTFWNLLRRHFPKRADALERRLTELLQLPWILPRLVGRWVEVAVDYHAIPYHGAPKKTLGNYDAANPNAARRSFTSMPPCASSSPAGVTRWRSLGCVTKNHPLRCCSGCGNNWNPAGFAAHSCCSIVTSSTSR